MKQILRELNSRIISLLIWSFGLGAQLHQEMNTARALILAGVLIGFVANCMRLKRYEHKLLGFIDGRSRR